PARPKPPTRECLPALRAPPGPQPDSSLLRPAGDGAPPPRSAPVSSLGGGEPVQRPEVLLTLKDARHDPNPEVRQSARAALARLGERQALQWFRQTLGSEDVQRVHETIQLVALEGLTLLWPDLDRLADSEDPDGSHHAQE